MVSVNLIMERIKKLKVEILLWWCIGLLFFSLPLGTAPPMLAAAITFVVWLFSKKALSVKDIFKQKWLWPVVLAILLPWIGLAYSPEKTLGLDYAMKTKYWVFTFIVAGLFVHSGRTDILIKSFISGIFINALAAIFQYAGFLQMIKKGHPGLGVVHTAASAYIVIGLIMSAMYFGREKRIPWKAGWLIIITVLLFHLAIMNGRAGYISFIFAGPLIAGYMMRGVSVFKKGVACCILIIALFFSPTVQNRIENTINNIKNNREEIIKGDWIQNDMKKLPRFYIYDSAVRMIMEHPFTGVGTGGLKHYTASKGHAVVHPHNNLLYMGVSFGITGIALCLWLFWNMLKTSWKYRDTQTGCFIMAIGLVIFIAGMFDTLIINSGTSILFCLGYGLLHQLGKEEHANG